MLIYSCFLAVFILYWIANRPFMNLVCHRDAGWHAYWAAFRKRGVRLNQQLNILMGCARIGSMFLFIFWFKLFGIRNPETISRKMFLVLNCFTAIILFFALKILLHDQAVLSFFVPSIYLLFSSNPFLGVHYETSERTTNFVNAIIFLLIGIFLKTPDNYLLGLIVFLMFLSAFFFKVTQVMEYFFMWLFLMISMWKLVYFPVSVMGTFAAFAIFYVVLKSKGLLTKENLGVFGYLSLNYKKPSDTIKDIERKIDKWVKNEKLKKVLQFLLYKVEGTRFEKFVSNGLVTSGKIFYRSKHYGRNIYLSSRSMIILCCFGVFLYPHLSVELFAIFWLIGCLANIVLQGKCLPFHYIPVLIPVSILAGLGVYKVWLNISSFNQVWFIIICFLAVVCVYKDVKFFLLLFLVNNKEPVDYKLWADSDRDVFEKNRAASEIVGYVKSNTTDDDHIFVWGCVPQLYVLCERRSPVPWLNTCDSLMSPIFPEWKMTMLLNLIKTTPKFLIQFEKDLNLAVLEEATGLRYEFDRTFFEGKYSIFKLCDIIDVDEHKVENYVDKLYQKIPLCAEYSV